MGKTDDNPNIKNVLLTTISTMNNPAVNCYRTVIDGKPYLCGGISQQEPGSKYFLSQSRFDRIIAICSEEVIGFNEDNAKKKVTADFRSEWDQLRSKWEESKNFLAFSVIDFYKLRLGAFLYDEVFDDGMIEDFIATLYKKQSFEDVEIIEKDRMIGDFKYDDDMTEQLVDCITNNKLIEDKEVVKYVNGYLSPARWKYEDDATDLLYQAFRDGKVDEDEDVIQYADSFDKNYGRSYLWYKIYKRAKEDNCALKPKDVQEDKPLEFVVVRDQYSNGVANINGIIDTIRKDFDEENINIFIDVQGGTRTSQFTVYNVMQILNDDVKFQGGVSNDMLHVCATYYNPRKLWENEIEDETKKYNIINAVSGMNAFIRYGRTNSLQTYFSKSKGKVLELNNQLNKFENAFQQNKIKEIQESIKSIYKIVDDKKDDENPVDEKEEMYYILKKQIYASFRGIVSNDQIDYVQLADWCFKHNHMQQGYTFAESKIPEYLIKNNIIHIGEDIEYLKCFYPLSYIKENELQLFENDKGELMLKSYKKSSYYEYKDPYHFFIAKYLNSNNKNNKKHLNINLNVENSDQNIIDIIGYYETLAKNRNNLVHVTSNSKAGKEPWDVLKTACEDCMNQRGGACNNVNLDNLKYDRYFKFVKVEESKSNEDEKKSIYKITNEKELFGALLKVLDRDMNCWGNDEKDRIYFLDEKLCSAIAIDKDNDVLVYIQNLLKYENSKKKNKILRYLWNAVFAGENEDFIKYVEENCKNSQITDTVKEKQSSIYGLDDTAVEVDIEEQEEENTDYELYDVEAEANVEEQEEENTDYESYDVEAEANVEEQEEENTDYESYNIEAEADVEEQEEEVYEENGYVYLKEEISQLNARVKELEWQIKRLEEQATEVNEEPKGFFAKLFKK